MTYPTFRVGDHVLLNGRERQATYLRQDGVIVFFSRAKDNPDPGLYSWDERRKGWIARIPVDQVDRVFSVSTFALYRGQRCLVEGIDDDGVADILYADENGAWATSAAGGFATREKYEYVKRVPIADLYDYHEEQLDLLFEDWRKNTFAPPAEAAP